jgi:phage terminase large subunit
MYIEEVLYEIELTPEKIKEKFLELNINKTTEIVSEYAGLGKSMNASLYDEGFNIFDVKKTQIVDGINRMYDFHMYIDINSKNLIEELRNYSWKKDKNDKILQEPDDLYNHLIDAIRYAQTKLRQRNYVQVYRKKR